MSLNRMLSDPLIVTLTDKARDQQVWLVGGAIRDQMLARHPLDLDFVVEKNARGLARRFADACEGLYYELDEERDIGRVILDRPGTPRRTIDFARLRGDDISADLLGRDFTVNAIAISLDDSSRLIDPSQGLQDLKDKILRACREDSLQADPVRTLRGIRIATDFGLHVEENTSRQIKSAGPRLLDVSMERNRDEFMRILDLARPAQALRVLDHLGILTILLPELEPLRGLRQSPAHAFDGLGHTLSVIERVGNLLGVLADKHDPDGTGDLVLAQASLHLGRFREQIRALMASELSVGRTRHQLLQFAALYHEVGKPDTSGTGGIENIASGQLGAEIVAYRAHKLRLSGAEVGYLQRVVRQHEGVERLEREPQITSRAVYRFFRDALDAGVDAVLISLADCLGKYAGAPPEDAWGRRVEVSRQLLTAFFEERELRIDPKALISGSDLLAELDLQPGPEVGRLLELVREAQAAGEVNSRTEAMDLVRASIKAR